jgi:glutathione S-transferase
VVDLLRLATTASYAACSRAETDWPPDFGRRCAGVPRCAIAQEILRWFRFVASRLDQNYLFGEAFTVADAYLFVMARGAAELGFSLPEPLPGYVARIEARPAVRAALCREGIGPTEERGR